MAYNDSSVTAHLSEPAQRSHRFPCDSVCRDTTVAVIFAFVFGSASVTRLGAFVAAPLDCWFGTVESEWPAVAEYRDVSASEVFTTGDDWNDLMFAGWALFFFFDIFSTVWAKEGSWSWKWAALIRGMCLGYVIWDITFVERCLFPNRDTASGHDVLRLHIAVSLPVPHHIIQRFMMEFPVKCFPVGQRPYIRYVQIAPRMYHANIAGVVLALQCFGATVSVTESK